MSLDCVFTNIDILERIFEHCDVYHNAFVAKIWSNEALSIIWRRLDSLLPLLNLLGPMTLTSEENEIPCYKYDRLIRLEDWIVFRRYSWRVQELVLEVDDTESDFNDSVFMDIITTNRIFSDGGELLPNLRHFKSNAILSLQKWIPLFMHKSLKSVTLAAPQLADTHIFMRTVSYLPHLCPSMQSLTLRLEYGPPLALDTIFSSLPLLNEVQISTSLLSLATLNTLARLPHLGSFSMIADFEWDDEELPKLDVMLLSNAFPSLTVFSSQTISFHLIASFLEAYRPRELRSLNVVSCTTETHDTCRSLFDAVVSTAPDVDDIHMESQPWSDNDPMPDSSLFPFFPTAPQRCLNITSLELLHPPPLKLDVENMKALLASLPSLVTLELSESTGPPTLPLSALSELAPLCPVMRFLSLYLNTKIPPVSTSPKQKFRCLEVLNIGRSPLQSSARNVATSFSMVLPHTCVLRHKHWDKIEATKWDSVTEILPLILELQVARGAFSAVQ
ncbi:hypothetical protein AB1N83_011260 [Pleurotus pulmonarius]